MTEPAPFDRLSVGIDIGGTFTDVVLVDEAGRTLARHKVDTTPSRFEVGFLNALARVSEERSAERFQRILHATTLATNAVLERKGSRTALLVTKGFRDILEIARQRRPSLYDLKAEKARPLVPRRRTFEVDERIGADGAVVTALSAAELDRIAAEIAGAGVESVVISLLFGYLNPAHELLLRDRLAKIVPNVVISSDIVPEFREFERTSTAVLVGYLKPIFARYTGSLVNSLEERGHRRGKLLIMNSAGGLMSAASATERPHTVVESGPAAGVIAAAALAADSGFPNAISFDMGGTTAKASLIEGATYRTTTEYEIGAGMNKSLALRFTGYPIKAPIIDLTECSAGGGSIASVDRLGMLKVGPRSAGAEPGPVCYGRGGVEPTVTDANLVLGRLNPDYFVGGETRLDADAARAAIAERIAGPLGVPLDLAAAGILALVNAHMVRILRVVSVARGLDPRDFSMIAFGGAGPLHAADLAAELGIPRVIVPDAPGVFSATGLLGADLRGDFSGTLRRTASPANAGVIADMLAHLEGDALAWLEREKVPPGQRLLLRSAEMRYPRQNYEIGVPLPGGRIDDAWLVEASNGFHAAHERLYGYGDTEEAVQIVNLRVAGIGRTERPPTPLAETGGPDPAAAFKNRRPVFFYGSGFADTPVYERMRLVVGNRIDGPAIVEQADSTTVVPPGFRLTLDPKGRLILEQSGRQV